MMIKPGISQFGSNGLLLSWASEINDAIQDAVMAYEAYFLAHFSDDIIETIPTYQSLYIELKKEISPELFLDKVQAIEPKHDQLKLKRHKYFIPICYDPKLGLDLLELASQKNIAPEQIKTWHQQTVYKVYFIGFLPGFLYLGGLDKRLYSTRKAVPRLKVPKGAVGIGGAQTGIYPQESPGGWQIIGQTPINLFDVSSHPPSLFLPGDLLEFQAVDFETFNVIRQSVDNGDYRIRKEVIND